MNARVEFWAKKVVAQAYKEGTSDPNEGVGMGWDGTYCVLCNGRTPAFGNTGHKPQSVVHRKGCAIPFLEEALKV